MNLKLKITDEKPVADAQKPRMNRVVFYALETLVVLCALFLLGLAVLLVRIHLKPLDVSFAKDYVLDQLRDDTTGARYDVDSIALYWPEFQDDFYLSVSNLRVMGAENQDLMSVDEVAVGLDKGHLFFGKVRPQVLVVQSPVLSVMRDSQGGIDVGFGAIQTNLETDVSDKDLAQQLLDVFYTKGRSKAFSKLDSLEVWDATVQLRDEIYDVDMELAQTDFIITRHEYGLVFSTKVGLPGAAEGDPTVGLYGDMVVPLRGEIVNADIRMHNAYAGFLAPFFAAYEHVLRAQSGRIDMRIDIDFDRNFQPQFFEFAAASLDGTVVVPDFYPDGLVYKDLNLQARYSADEKVIFIDEQSGVALDDVPIRIGADLAWNDGEVTGPVRVDIEALSHKKLAEIWPRNLVDDSSYEWAVKKITEASFNDAFAQFYLRAGQDVETNIQDVLAGFGFRGATINYRAPLTPVTKAIGSTVFNLDQERMDVDVSSARLKDMDIPKADLIFTDIIAEKQGKVDIQIKLAGPLQTAFRYIQDEPIGADVDMDLAKVQGQAELDLHVVMPLLKDLDLEDVQIDIKGVAQDTVLPGLVRDMDVTGGPFDIHVAQHLLTVTGKGQLNKRDVDAVYEQYLISEGKPYSSRIQAKITADPNLRKIFGIDLDDFLTGSVPVDVTYKTLSPARASVDVAGDLTGVRVFVDAFGYGKAPGVSGSFGLQAHLLNDGIQKITGLKVQAPGLALANSQLDFINDDLSGGVLRGFQIGETSGLIDFKILSTGVQHIDMDAAFLDLRPFLEKDEGEPAVYDDPPRKISVTASRIRGADGYTMSGGKMYLDIDSQGKFKQLEMDATAGKGAIYLRYKPDDSGKRVFRLEADDAGATLQAFDLYDKIRGGKLVIYGEPIRGIFDRNLLGKAEMTDFRVVKAPGLAKLLSALSLPGILSLLNNDGLTFTKLEADFNWLYRRQGSVLVLKDGRTSGNSVGFTFDGTFDNAADTIDISGTIVPLSGINNLVSNIPLVGQILSGGTGSVFAATYTMKGEGNDPKVVVNPLAALTPGILRRIFFEQK